MTSAAILAEFSVVIVIFLMAGETISWCTLEHVVDMTVSAFHFGMFAFQLESG